MRNHFATHFFLMALCICAPAWAQTTVQNTTYASGQSVTVTDPVSITTGYNAVTVSSGASVTYSAGQSINLYPGFTAYSGSIFQALVANRIYTTPAYEPTYWNDNSFYNNGNGDIIFVPGQIEANNNCYNYANNKRTDTFAQPGRAGGQEFGSLTAQDLYDATVRDGLEPTTASAVSPTGKTKIALVLWPDKDFHYYRQDNNGMWSGKDGNTDATDLDFAGSPIASPETANRGPYSTFVGYFFTPSDSVQGQGHANIN